MSARPRPSPGEGAAAAACLAMAAAFLAWVATSSVTELSAAEVAGRRLGEIVLPALAAAVVLVAALAFLRAKAVLARAVFASALVYLGFLKLTGFDAAPFAALAGALVLGVSVREPPPVSGALVLLHAMGLMAGLHMVFAMPRYLAAVGPFRDVLWALAKLVS